MTFMRWVVGRLILTIDFLTQPKPVVRQQARQTVMDGLTANLSLYQFNACPFCVKVRRHIKKHALRIEFRDARNNVAFRNELTEQGGRHKVPCLRIEKSPENVVWLYESNDIISFLTHELALN